MLNKKNEKGNVLFLILIAVALFAALSYAVTQSSRSGGDAGRETNVLNSAQLSQYPNQVRTAIVRQIIDGTSATAIRFNAPADFEDLDSNRIGVFHPEGGGAVFQDAQPDMMEDGNAGVWHYNMEFEVPDIGISTPTGQDNEAGNEIIAFLPNVTLDVCRRINLEANVRENISDTPPVSADFSASYALDMIEEAADDYDLPTAEVILDSTSDAGIFDGKTFGCFRNTASGPYVYYHVLYER